MTIRIDSDKLAGAASSQTGQTEQVRSGRARSSWTQDARQTGGDSIQISSMAGAIADASAVGSAEKSERVKQLSALYASGRYQPDSLQVSRSMVSRALTESSGGIK
jgi:anti-sigma28 factor (negative regulator of flagellin synthesis)